MSTRPEAECWHIEWVDIFLNVARDISNSFIWFAAWPTKLEFIPVDVYSTFRHLRYGLPEHRRWPQITSDHLSTTAEHLCLICLNSADRRRWTVRVRVRMARCRVRVRARVRVGVRVQRSVVICGDLRCSDRSSTGDLRSCLGDMRWSAAMCGHLRCSGRPSPIWTY